MTNRQLEILQHTLGVDEYGQGQMYRNHFCSGPADEPDCRALVSLGYMQQHETTTSLPYFNCSVTEQGKMAMKAASPKAPKVTRDQQRYREFLNLSDAYNCTFKEWLGIRKTDWYQKRK